MVAENGPAVDLADPWSICRSRDGAWSSRRPPPSAHDRPLDHVPRQRAWRRAKIARLCSTSGPATHGCPGNDLRLDQDGGGAHRPAARSGLRRDPASPLRSTILHRIVEIRISGTDEGPAPQSTPVGWSPVPDRPRPSLRPGMGAIKATDLGSSGTAFRVWAPHADGVSVAGTFDGWDATRNPLARDGTGPPRPGRRTSRVRTPATSTGSCCARRRG